MSLDVARILFQKTRRQVSTRTIRLPGSMFRASECVGTQARRRQCKTICILEVWNALALPESQTRHSIFCIALNVFTDKLPITAARGAATIVSSIKPAQLFYCGTRHVFGPIRSWPMWLLASVIHSGTATRAEESRQVNQDEAFRDCNRQLPWKASAIGKNGRFLVRTCEKLRRRILQSNCSRESCWSIASARRDRKQLLCARAG